jgi:flavin-binding protein dodecin
VDKLDVRIEDGKIVEYRVRVKLSFKFEGSD